MRTKQITITEEQARRVYESETNITNGIWSWNNRMDVQGELCLVHNSVVGKGAKLYRLSNNRYAIIGY